MNHVLSDAKKAGVKVFLFSGNVRVKLLNGQVSETLLERLRARKDEIKLHLEFIARLGRHSPVSSPGGEGVVWEIYPNCQRVGILLTHSQWPVFFNLAEIISPNGHQERASTKVR